MSPARPGEGLERCVYYRVPAALQARLAPALHAAQARLCADRPGLQARLLRRPQADAQGRATWMEVYTRPPRGLTPQDGPAIEAALAPLLLDQGLDPGERHIEDFLPLAPGGEPVGDPDPGAGAGTDAGIGAGRSAGAGPTAPPRGAPAAASPPAACPPSPDAAPCA